MVLGLTCVISSTAFAQKREGCHIEEITDQDGDLQILMESEWISMHLQPSMGSTIVRFVFRPTGRDILEEVIPKFPLAGGGLLQDNFWEQDWRYSEFRSKLYDYKIVKNTPAEVAVAFQTKSVGYLQGEGSGTISKLLSNIRIRRTVTLRSGAPYFLFDIEMTTEDGRAKLPLMWLHNSAMIDAQQGDQVHRPSVRGVRRIGAVGRPNTAEFQLEDHVVRDFTEGWSARISASRKEGIVYLVDYNYLQFLYNCGTTTDEWVDDNVLITKERPWKSRMYILPVMGLSRVDYANEYFILEVDPRRDKDSLNIVLRATSSYEPIKRITFTTEMEWGHLSQTQKRKLDPVELQGLGIAPVETSIAVANPPDDPLLLNLKAHIEMADGSVKTQEIQHFHVGSYSYHDNVRVDLKTPVVALHREPLKPFVPTPSTTAAVNRKDWNVFAMLGNHSNPLHLREAVRSIPAVMSNENDVGFTPGWVVNVAGLTDFPYDYERLFNYRVMLIANCEPDVPRMVGASILVNYLKAGGGLVLTGGESAFRAEFTDPPHPLNDYIPVQPKPDNIRKQTRQLSEPAKDHPIFQGIDLSNLPYAYYYQDVELKPKLPSKVLMKVGDKPFIVELTQGDQRTVAVLCVPFGDEAQNPGKAPFWKWDQWQKLIANIVRYAGHG